MPEQGSADSASYVGAETKRRKNLPPTVEERQYNQICSRKGVTTSGCFARQLNDNVADVSYSMLGPNDIRCISVALKTNVTIKDLDLTGNDLSGKGALYLAKALAANSTVDDVTLEECNIDLPGLQALCAVLQDMKTINYLVLSKNKFGMRHSIHLAEVIELNDSIEHLVLAGNEIDTFGGSYIGKALCSNVGLKRLDLSWNHIRREAAVAICSALKFNTTLEDLDLSWNGISVDGCRAHGHALPHNHTLQHLSLACNRINPLALHALLPGLQKNDSLKELRLSMNPLTSQGSIALLRCIMNSENTRMKEIYIMDSPINEEFCHVLETLKKQRPITIHHSSIFRTDLKYIDKDRTLSDYDPKMVIFEYMKQKQMRLIDLFRMLDKNCSNTVTKNELREGFNTINMPLTDEAIDSLFETLDLDGSGEIKYDE